MNEELLSKLGATEGVVAQLKSDMEAMHTKWLQIVRERESSLLDIQSTLQVLLSMLGVDVCEVSTVFYKLKLNLRHSSTAHRQGQVLRDSMPLHDYS